MQDEPQKWGHWSRENMGADFCELRSGQGRGQWHPVIFFFIRQPPQKKNFPPPCTPSRPRKVTPRELVLLIWLGKKSSIEASVTPITGSNFYIHLVLLICSSNCREFDLLSLLLTSHSVTFAHSKFSFFCSIALGTDNIKLSKSKRCQKSFRTQSRLLTKYRHNSNHENKRWPGCLRVHFQMNVKENSSQHKMTLPSQLT